ncbi:MAG: hypothetical protein RL009_1011 [Actinomycetota bacterium]|jgi:uncharacterized protein YdhG (YjbR/CyaY superfamily)
MAEKFTAEEREAMKERARELKAAKGVQNKAADEALVLEKIAAMAPGDRALAQRIHELVKLHAPQLDAKTWYGMQAYFKDGKVVCFFQDGGKFKTRYCTFGFQDAAKLDDGMMWPTSFAILEIDDEVAVRIANLLQRAAAD